MRIFTMIQNPVSTMRQLFMSGGAGAAASPLEIPAASAIQTGDETFHSQPNSSLGLLESVDACVERRVALTGTCRRHARPLISKCPDRSVPDGVRTRMARRSVDLRLPIDARLVSSSSFTVPDLRLSSVESPPLSIGTPECCAHEAGRSASNPTSPSEFQCSPTLGRLDPTVFDYARVVETSSNRNADASS
jgi:hypothetical protein